MIVLLYLLLALIGITIFYGLMYILFEVIPPVPRLIIILAITVGIILWTYYVL